MSVGDAPRSRYAADGIDVGEGVGQLQKYIFHPRPRWLAAGVLSAPVPRAKHQTT